MPVARFTPNLNLNSVNMASSKYLTNHQGLFDSLGPHANHRVFQESRALGKILSNLASPGV